MYRIIVARLRKLTDGKAFQMEYFKASVSTRQDLNYQVINVWPIAMDGEDLVRVVGEINGFYVHDFEMRITTYPSSSPISPFDVDFECIFRPHSVDAHKARAMLKTLDAIERSIRVGQEKNGAASAGQKVLYAMRALKVRELVVTDEDNFRSMHRNGGVAEKINSMVYLWKYEYTRVKEGG
jgi:hypothetical protein